MTDDRKTPAQDSLFVDSRGRRQQSRWIAAAERRADARRAFEALPAEERTAILARLDRLLFVDNVWQIARSMIDNPHAYTRSRTWRSRGDFEWAVTMIRNQAVTGCERQKFAGRWYDTLVRPHPLTGVPCRFWPMNWPLSQTILINRKPTLETDR